jgi:molecular chaperone GrpE
MMTEEQMPSRPEDDVAQAPAPKAEPSGEKSTAQGQQEAVAEGSVEKSVEKNPERDVAAELAAAKTELARVGKALAEAELRAQAEIQNMRRRAEMDVEKAHKFALERFARDILGVADSLERGLGSLDKDDEALKSARDGMELTLKQLLDVLARFQVVQIDPAGAPFDPENHEAMTQIPHPDAEPNTVVDVLEKGYSLNGRLLRPARVVVAK